MLTNHPGGSWDDWDWKGDMVWDRQFHLCSCCGTAPNFESGSNLLGPLVHANHAPVPIPPSRPSHFRIDPAAVVAHCHAQPYGQVFNFSFMLVASEWRNALTKAPVAIR
jgi:hypothetical protein